MRCQEKDMCGHRTFGPLYGDPNWIAATQRSSNHYYKFDEAVRQTMTRTLEHYQIYHNTSEMV